MDNQNDYEKITKAECENDAEMERSVEPSVNLPKNKQHLGVLFMILHGLALSLSYLISRVIYLRHP